MYGYPLAQKALGIAFLSEAAPLLGAAAISSPAVTSTTLFAGPYSLVILGSAEGFFIHG